MSFIANVSLPLKLLKKHPHCNNLDCNYCLHQFQSEMSALTLFTHVSFLSLSADIQRIIFAFVRVHFCNLFSCCGWHTNCWIRRFWQDWSRRPYAFTLSFQIVHNDSFWTNIYRLALIDKGFVYKGMFIGPVRLEVLYSWAIVPFWMKLLGIVFFMSRRSDFTCKPFSPC